MWVFGVFASVAFVVFSAFVVLMVWYVQVEPEEPVSAGQHATDRWMLAVAVMLLLVALVVLAGAALQSLALASGALALHLVLAGIILRYALDNSHRSDGKLVLFAAIVELTGLAGLLGAARERSFGY
jgi:hypothetical protein